MVTISEYYESYWKEPEKYYDPTTPQRQQLLSRHLSDLPAGAAILDVGCGRGEFCAFFLSRGFTAEGIDLSTSAIEYARSQHPNVRFHRGEVQSLLPERANSFQCVFSSEVIEHLFDVESYLRSINRLLVPGGRFVLTTPYHGLLKNVVIDLMKYHKHYDPLGQHIRFFNRVSLSTCLKQFGFEPNVWTGYGRSWPFWKSFFVVTTKSRDA